MEFLENLLKIGALTFGEFTLASGERSGFYLDLRLLPSYPDLFDNVSKKLWKMAKSVDWDIVIGIPTAGVPFATYVAILDRKPLNMIRKEPKDHGTRRLIEGIDILNKKILLVDDLISSGVSKEFAIRTIRDEGGIVHDLLVVADRRENEQAGKLWEEKLSVKLHSLYYLPPSEVAKFGKRVPV